MKMFVEKVIKLLEVKKIIAICLTIVFCYLSMVKLISAEQFLSVFLIIIGFYYGQSTMKSNK